MKKNYLEEKSFYKDETNKYFNNYLPIKFDKLQDEYNVILYGSNLKKILDKKEIKQEIDNKNIYALALIKENIEIYYDNVNIDVREQRFLLANLISTLEVAKFHPDLKMFLKDYDNVLKCDETFNGMTSEEYNEYIHNYMARQILMPKKHYDKLYSLFAIEYEDERIVKILSTIFVVPEREVIIRGKELGYNLDLDYLNAKAKKLV